MFDKPNPTAKPQAYFLIFFRCFKTCSLLFDSESLLMGKKRVISRFFFVKYLTTRDSREKKQETKNKNKHSKSPKLAGNKNRKKLGQIQKLNRKTKTSSRANQKRQRGKKNRNTEETWGEHARSKLESKWGKTHRLHLITNYLHRWKLV